MERIKTVIKEDNWIDAIRHYWPFNLAYDILGGDQDKMQELYLPGIPKAMEVLNEREKEAIRLRYQEGYTFERVGKAHGVTRERARQICNKALRKMRHPNRIAEFIGVSKAEFNSALRECSHYQAKAEEAEKAKSTAEELLQKTCPTIDLRIATKSLNGLNLSVRSWNALGRVGVTTLGELSCYTLADLGRVPGLGKKSIEEITEAMARNGLSLRPSATCDYKGDM